MKFRSYDSLKIFDAVARQQSMTVAAHDLNLSKGSISYQINKLEADLGFALFERNNARLQLTDSGRRLWNVSQNAIGKLTRKLKISVAYSLTHFVLVHLPISLLAGFHLGSSTFLKKTQVSACE